ncbi:hypothetical protein AAE478_001802 [Parahypoxylon ruwenzoriense]
MAGRSVSPGAALLRSSRMFSMPAPIPAPPGDFSSATKHYSPTATINFPTHLTVTTPSTSRANGDWGFKRPFPLKTTTNTTHALIRVKQVDSTEHVTDFQSATDHTITLRKYQEMNLPISMPSAGAYETYVQSRNPKSVFEEDGDATALDEDQKAKLANKRWKFTGPWLAGMTDGEFNKYLEKKVRGRRPEFRAFLRETLAAEMTEDRVKNAREAGKEADLPKVSAGEISDNHLMDYLRELRHDRMNLYNLVSRFLDLAPIALDTELRMLGGLAPGKAQVLDRGSPYGQKGPPITHPSAGLSYLRTRNFEENHPLYGPQKEHPPIKARVLKPTNIATGNFRPSIGIAGFVASIPGEDSGFLQTKKRNPNAFIKSMQEIELEKVGGSKVYVRPTTASLDSSGRVLIAITETDSGSEVVQKELVGEGTVFEDVLKHQALPQVPRNPMYRSNGYATRLGRRVSGDARSYGFERNI